MEQDVDSIGTFTSLEIERAVALPDRAFELIKRKGLITGQVTDGGRGRQARYQFRTLSRMILVAQLSRYGNSFMQAARITNEISPEIEARYDGGFPFGFWDMQFALSAKGVPTDSFRGPDGEFCPYRTFETAWRNGLTDDEHARSNDYKLVIANGEWVGMEGFDNRQHGLLRYTQSTKTTGTKIEAINDEVTDAVFKERFQNAESVLRLNLGLSIRRALVSIIKEREARQ